MIELPLCSPEKPRELLVGLKSQDLAVGSNFSLSMWKILKQIIYC